MQQLRAILLYLFQPATPRAEHSQQGEALQVPPLRQVLRTADQPGQAPQETRERRSHHLGRVGSKGKVLPSQDGPKGSPSCSRRHLLNNFHQVTLTIGLAATADILTPTGNTYSHYTYYRQSNTVDDWFTRKNRQILFVL